ncbi:MAG: hypothetical protein FJ267_17605 [Planctomycetes bacterium]|nr:hypothetical protein [Planctomycetota bacterium]
MLVVTVGNFVFVRDSSSEREPNVMEVLRVGMYDPLCVCVTERVSPKVPETDKLNDSVGVGASVTDSVKINVTVGVTRSVLLSDRETLRESSCDGEFLLDERVLDAEFNVEELIVAETDDETVWD